ncbi:MAG: RNA methyltransferase [Pseudomonadota bacterium]
MPSFSPPPAILLVQPQLGENIGSAARVMLNFGLTDLRLVAPRDGWPNPAAETLSAGAFSQGVTVHVFENTPDAIADLTHVFAATARPRGMEKPVMGAPEAAAQIAGLGDGRAGILFGGESSGLSNDDVSLADKVLTYPVNPMFSSLNLAMAVGVFAQSWGDRSHTPPAGFRTETPPATRADLVGMFEHLEAELERAGYFFPPEKTAVMVQNLRAAFTRGHWTTQEVRTFRGAIKALAVGRGKARIKRDP